MQFFSDKPEKFLVPLILATLSALAFIVIDLKGNAIDGAAFDLSAATRSFFKTSPHEYEVVIIGVDAQSQFNSRTKVEGYTLRELPPAFMHPVWAKLIRGLVDDPNVKAKRIGFDFALLWDPGRLIQNKQFDLSFRHAVVDHLGTNKVILIRGKQKIAEPYQSYPTFGYKPIALGNSNFISDADGISRRKQLHNKLINERERIFSFAALLSGKCGPQKPNLCAEIPSEFLLLPDERVTNIPSYHLSDVIQCINSPFGKTDLKERFKNKIILVGETIPGRHDQMPPDRFMKKKNFTDLGSNNCSIKPLLNSSTYRVPKIFMSALAVESILNKRTPVQVSASFVAIFTFIVTLLVSFLAQLWNITSCGITCLAAVLGLFISATIGLHFNLWFPAGMPSLLIFTASLASYFYRYVTEDQRQKLLQLQFASCLNPRMLNRLADASGTIKLSGETRRVTFLVSGFPNMLNGSDWHPTYPERVTNLLNKYLRIFVKVTLENNGTYNRYSSNHISAFWNAPLNVENHALKACQAGIGLQKAIANLSDSRSVHSKSNADLKSGKIAIGISLGNCIAGITGWKKLIRYSLLGEPAKLATYFSNLCEVYGVNIIIGPEIANVVKEQMLVLDIDRITNPTTNTVITISTILDYKDLFGTKKFGYEKYMHEKTLAAYEDRNWDLTSNQVARCEGNFEGRLDTYYSLLAKRVEKLKAKQLDKV